MLGGWVASLAVAGAAAFLEFPRVELLLGGLLAVTLVVTVVVGRSDAFVRRDARATPKPTPSAPLLPPAGWFPDPTRRNAQRFWDGRQWTDDVLIDGTTGSDPMDTGRASG